MRRRPLGIGARLAALFAVVVAASCGALCLYLYVSFADQLARRDDLQLLGKLRQVRLQLGNAATPELLLARPQYLRDTMSGESNALILVRTAAGGATLLEINPEHQALPAPPPLDEAHEPALANLVRWRAADGSPGAAVAAYARLGRPDGRRVLITVARSYPERDALLAAYRWRIGSGAMAASLAAALLSALVIWRALAPLRRLRREADAITASRLSTRLTEPGAPPEIAQLVHALNAMFARLEEGFARLSQFSSDLAHELRTPVGNLLGQNEVMLARTRSTAEYQALLESNVEELARLGKMIDNMLFIARADHAQHALELRPLSVLPELERLADYFEGLAAERNVAIACAGSGKLNADAALFRRALGNLLANAVRHARQGSTIRLTARQTPSACEICVANEGEPLPTAALERLFDRFYRLDAARTDAAESNGLGLAIVRSIMTLHGGQARVEQDGAWLRFVLRFPGDEARAAPGDSTRGG